MTCQCPEGFSPNADPRYQSTCRRCARMEVVGGPPSGAKRDLSFERPFLTLSGGSSYAAQVKDRVDLHDRIHGARWGSFSIARMLSEIEEEGLDVGGWGVLLAQLPALLDLDDERVHDVRLLLQETMRHGAAITTLTEQIRGVLD